MSRKLALILALPVLFFSFNVQAFSVLSMPAETSASDMILVRGFCGLGFHRGPYGGCIRNGTVVAPPVVVAPRYAPPPVAVEPVCPYGYYLDQYGRCLPY